MLDEELAELKDTITYDMKKQCIGNHYFK
jgi:hypothetical protein